MCPKIKSTSEMYLNIWLLVHTYQKIIYNIP